LAVRCGAGRHGELLFAFRMTVAVFDEYLSPNPDRDFGRANRCIVKTPENLRDICEKSEGSKAGFDSAGSI
jgi:hypothetical protein